MIISTVQVLQTHDIYRYLMIQNIVILLIANTLIPLLPFPPELAAPIPLAHLLLKETTVYEHMNLPRLHTEEQFKKAFRDSLKTLHPDRGGDPDAFAKVKNLKKIMEQQVNSYDTLNVTDIDLAYNEPYEEVVKVKETSYFVEAGIYYFVVTLYALSYTIDQDLKPARKYILPLIIIFAAYEAHMHFHPQVATVFDYLHNKLPIFLQKTILKNLLSVYIAIIRTRFSRSLTTEKKLLNSLDQPHTEAEYRDIVQGLHAVYQQRAKKKAEKIGGWGTKIKGWISKAFTVLILFSIVKGFFGGGQAAGGKGDL